jgi:glycosyltransferase involved in cell wall biosynthesis
VTFLLPDFLVVPTGGLKVAYQFANGLAERGHAVTVLHLDTLVGHRFERRIRRDARFWLWRRGRGGWFDLGRGIEARLIQPADVDGVPSADHLVAIGWRSVDLVRRAPDRAGRKHYLVQGYMPAEGAPGEVDAAWRIPIHKMVISRWLKAKAEELGPAGLPLSVVHIPIGEEFRPWTAIADRDASSIATYFHPERVKGFKEALEALLAVRQRYPIKVATYGADRPQTALPDWMSFRYRPHPRDTAAILNRAAIFVHASANEGFGLLPAEAMASGCAFAAFANQGVSEYAVNERNALLVRVGDVEGLAGAIERLVEDRELRLRVASQAVVDMAAYSMTRSIDELEAALAEVS